MRNREGWIALQLLVVVVCWAGLPAPAQAATLYALVDTGEIFASVDGGVSWPIQGTIPVSDAAGLVAASSASELYLASRSGTVYRSPDAAVTWSAVGAVPASDVVDLAVRPDGALLALTRSGTVWVSTDGGAMFAAEASLGASDLVSLARDASGALCAVTGTGTIRRSVDGGATWVVVGTVPVSDAVAVRCGGDASYVLAGTGLTYRSQDQGATWIAVGTMSQVGMTALTVSEGELVAVSREGLVAQSPDGTAWTWVGVVNQLNVVALGDDTPQAVGVPERPGTALRLRLAPPRPNPLRSGETLALEVSLPEDDILNVALYDAEGRLAASRAPEPLPASEGSMLRWNPGPLPAGVYFVRVAGRRGSSSRRLVVVP